MTRSGGLARRTSSFFLGIVLLLAAMLAKLGTRCECGGEAAYSCFDSRFVSCYFGPYADVLGRGFARAVAADSVVLTAVVIGVALVLHGITAGREVRA